VARVELVASPDDYLLELELDTVIAAVRAACGGVEPEVFGPETAPEKLAVELCSPSLFTPQRLLVAPEIGSWVDVPALKQSRLGARPATVDATVLVQVLGEGVADGIVLVLGACCHGRPRGALISAVEDVGQVHWHPVPDAPKPWEDLVLSKDQERLLSGLLERTAGEIGFTPAARCLLFERLGFAPRSLVQEARKLVAASADGTVDEDLVRALSFPRERSLEVVSEGLLSRRVAPLLDLMAAAQDKALIRDWSGRAIDNERVASMVFSSAVMTFQQLLYLRRLAARVGLADEMAPQRTSDEFWYPRRFSKGIGPALASHLEADAPSPMVRAGSKPPSIFRLGTLFRGAGRYTDRELVDGLAAAGEVELAGRGNLAIEAVAVWLVGVFGTA
jgi:hypothetical protein